MAFCLFCYKSEKGKQQSTNDFVCSNCVALFTRLEQDTIRRLYDRAVEQELIHKAEALKLFILEGDENEQRNPKRNLAKCSYGNRPHRTFRNDKNSNWKFEKPKKPSLYQGHG